MFLKLGFLIDVRRWCLRLIASLKKCRLSKKLGLHLKLLGRRTSGVNAIKFSGSVLMIDSTKTICKYVQCNCFNLRWYRFTDTIVISNRLMAPQCFKGKLCTFARLLMIPASGCSTAVERMPYDREFVGSNPASCWAFILFSHQ